MRSARSQAGSLAAALRYTEGSVLFARRESGAFWCDPMIILLTTLHVIVCLFLIIVVLLQSGKAADLAGAFGGMGSQTAFGPRGAATVLSKATTVAAALFMVTSLSLSVAYTRQGGAGGGSSVLERSAKPATTQPKQTPAPGPGAPAAGQPAPPPSIQMQTPSGEKVTIPIPQKGAPAAPPPAPAKK
jgi:preprotein translocase subunit SecG